jgi:hypothetical protein
MFILRTTLFRKIFPAIVLIALTLFSVPSAAQTNYEDVVYLKNGSIIHGMIIEQVPNESIKIQTADRNIFVFKMDEILKITKEEITPVPVPASKKSQPVAENVVAVPEKMRDKGYVNILEITNGLEMLHNHSNAALTGAARANSQITLGVQDINGYRFNRQLSVGVGIGWHIYPGLLLMPLFADIRFHFSKHGISPFLDAAIGYSFTQMEVIGFESSKDYYGGLLVNPAFGVRFPIRSRFAFIMSFGYRYQEANIYTHNVIFNTNNRYETEYYQSQTLGYMNFKVGFEF